MLAFPVSGQVLQGPVPEPVRPRLTAVGDGEARAQPDIAIVTVGAVQIAPSASVAMADVNQRVSATIDALKGLGVLERDIQTSGLSLQPIQRPRASSDQGPPEIEAYRASINLVVTVRDVSRAGAVLDAAQSSGANVIGGMRFALSDPSRVRARALANAVENAGRYAQEMAAAAGVHPAEVISIADESSGLPGPRPVAEARAALSADASTPIEAGELVMQARVRVTYALSP
ncbi:MAG: SIMPL domain-containing protein [Chloroflexi bacterium]|nr:SIMPL domain-containing protein [Chloroflexota bacterium]